MLLPNCRLAAPNPWRAPLLAPAPASDFHGRETPDLRRNLKASVCARVLHFEQLGEEIFAECGGSAVPEITPIGRQMILGHLLRRHAPQLTFFRSVERQAGLAAELDATFDELERAGKTADDLALLMDDLGQAGSNDVEGVALRAKLHDVRLLYQAYREYLGQDRLDQHRRLEQVLKSVETCSFVKRATVYVDGFLEFTDHERRMLGAIAQAGARMEITLLMDPHCPLLRNPHLMPKDMGLFHRTETTYRRLGFTFSELGVKVNAPVVLEQCPRFVSEALSRLERELFSEDNALFVGKAGSLSPAYGSATVTAGRKQGSKSKAVAAPFPPVPAGSDRAANHPLEKENLAKKGAADIKGHPGLDDAFSITRLEAADRATEVDAVARRVRQLLSEGLRLRDISVLARSLKTYLPHVAASFEEHGIAYFVDRRRAASHHPLVQLLRSALHIAQTHWSHDAVASLLKTGLADLSLDEADELENYVLLHRVRGRGWESREPWTWRHDLLRGGEDASPASDAEDPLRIDRLRRRVSDGVAPLAQLFRAGKPLPARLIASEIFAMFERFGVRAALGRMMDLAAENASAGIARGLEERDEHEQVWARLIELFEQMVDLLGDEEVTPADFIDIVESGLEQFDLAITPPTADEVLVGQADRTRFPPVKAVFVLGLNEGEFPVTPREASVLSDRERRELRRRNIDLDPESQRQLLDERLLGYITFTQPSERLILCRPLGDDKGRPTSPSVFWRRIGKLFPSVQTVNIPREITRGIDQISTPRQLVTSLMRWVRSGAADPVKPVATA